MSRRWVLPGLVAIGLTLASLPGSAFNVYYRNNSGGVDLVAASIGTIARRGSTFDRSEFRYKMTSLLFTYPDYPELGYNTPENEATARSEAERLNQVIQELHKRGIKALAHSYEIEVPRGFIPRHPEMECSGAGMRMDGNKPTWFIPGEKSGGLCIYRPGAREFIQRRFDELFRRLPDLDGVIFSLNESAVRPYRGCCSVCCNKSLEDKVRDMVALLDSCITKAMHKAHPEKNPFNIARSWGVPEFVARRDPEKIRQLTRAFLECPPDVPIVIKVGYGDYDINMDTAPVAVAMARAGTHPFLLDVGRRGVEPFAPGIFGYQNQKFFRDTKSRACVGLFYGRSRPESDGHPFKLDTLNWDTAVALLHNPNLSLVSFYREWAKRELHLDDKGAHAMARILRNWETLTVLGGAINGCDWPLAGGLAGLSSIDGLVRPGSRWTWNFNWMDKTAGIYGLRANIFEASTDSLGTAEEKYRRVLQEKLRAVGLAEENLRLAAQLQPSMDASREKEIEKLMRQALWWTKSREALARSYWRWWFLPRTQPSQIASAYREYLAVLDEPVGDPHRDMFLPEREDMEVTVASFGFPVGDGIISYGSSAMKCTGQLRPEGISDVERGDPRRVWLPNGGRGSASVRFGGKSGVYELGVKFRGAESPGTFELKAGSRALMTWTVAGSDTPSDEWRFVKTHLVNGETITAEVEGPGPSCRLYRIHLRRLGEPAAIPKERPTAHVMERAVMVTSGVP